MRLEFTRVNANKLHDELIASGIIPATVESKDEVTWVYVNENEVSSVHAVVAAHDPTPTPQPLSETEKLRQELNEMTVMLGDLLLGGV